MTYPHVCLFCGHRVLTEDLYPAILAEVERLIVEEGVTEFWSGGYGNFDAMCERAVRKLKSAYPQIKLVLVVAYHPEPGKKWNSKREFEKFDDLYMPDLGNVPKPLAIAKRNQVIAKQAGHVLAGVMGTQGGAGKTLETAVKAGAKIHRIEI